VGVLGGDTEAAATTGRDLERRYSEPHRHYHTVAHVESVLGDARRLAGCLALDETDEAILVLAVCAHDVVYGGIPGEDERASAEWASSRLEDCRIAPEAVDRVRQAVLATAAHTAPGPDAVVACLLDADLAILAAPEADYEAYRSGVRREYGRYDDQTWAVGRIRVLRHLAGRARLYVTDPGTELWDKAARTNIGRELRRLGDATTSTA
jgi:predicted metal-dependent HD superfamily phosphohydrolase